jgi:imidazolonepropionase-like amidohydrolase
MEIWVAPLDQEPVREQHVRLLSRGGGNTFSFTPDGSAIIYSAANRVWHQALAGGEPEEFPIRLELSPITAPPLLVRKARVLDLESGGFGPEVSLLIEDGRIRWIGSELGHQLPRNVTTLDAGGRFLIPGLFDLHITQGRFFGEEEMSLAYGVTAVRKSGNGLAWQNAAADRGEASADPIPRYFSSSETIRQFGQVPGWLAIHSEEDARTFARRSKEWGALNIMIYNTTAWPVMRAAAHEARRLGLPVIGHGTNVQEITKSVTAGFTTVEHITTPSRVYDDVLQMLAEAGTGWVPTLTTLHERHSRLVDAPTQPQVVPGQALDTTELREQWVDQLAGIRSAHQRGVKLQAGGEYGPHRLHKELELFVEAGVEPIDVLRIATQGAATAVGAEDHLGTLEVGKLADIVLLDANPLEDIKNTQTIWRVIKGGWVFDPEELKGERN